MITSSTAVPASRSSQPAIPMHREPQQKRGSILQIFKAAILGLLALTGGAPLGARADLLVAYRNDLAGGALPREAIPRAEYVGNFLRVVEHNGNVQWHVPGPLTNIGGTVRVVEQNGNVQWHVPLPQTNTGLVSDSFKPFEPVTYPEFLDNKGEKKF